MKNLFLLTATILVVGISGSSIAQTINWMSLKQEQKHTVSVNVGWDYATSLGVGYGYKLNTKIPITLNAQFSVPAGNNLSDDFKAKLGGQSRVFKAGNFQTTVMVYGIFRQFEKTNLVKFQNFRGEFKGVAGYYKPTWFVAAEFGFDKAIVTHIKNSQIWNNIILPPAMAGTFRLVEILNMVFKPDAPSKTWM